MRSNHCLTKPFDRFTAYQLAGDLLPAPQRTAFGHNCQVMAKEEGGA